jgi:hypothetical protein
MGIDQRRHKRVTIKSVAEVVGEDDGRFQAFVGGISRGGLELYAPKPVAKNAHLRMVLTFLDKDGKTQEENVAGVVRWSARFESSYLSGIEFEQLVDPERNPALAAYIENAERYYA